MSVKWRLCCCLGVWVCLLYNFPLTEGQYSVIGSPQPIVAVAGDDIILPCHVEPALSAVDMTIEWSRPDLTPRHVHLHQDGRSSSDGQNPSYRYRTTLFTGELKNGNVSLKLFRVKLSDEGMYRCFIPSSGSQVKETEIQLIVGAVFEPKLSLVDLENERVVLQCESGGWYPEPEVEWLDSEGHVLSAGPTETVKDPDGTYTVRRLVTVEKTATNRFTCRAQQQYINQTRETDIHVPGHIYITSQSVRCTGAIGVGVAALLILGVTVALIFIIWRRKKDRNEGKPNEQELRLLTEKEKIKWSTDEERCYEGAAVKRSDQDQPNLEETEHKLLEDKKQQEAVKLQGAVKLQEAVKQQKQIWKAEQTKKDLEIVKKGLEDIRKEQIQTEDTVIAMVQELKKKSSKFPQKEKFKTSHVDKLKESLLVTMIVLKSETDKLSPQISTIERLLPFLGSNMQSSIRLHSAGAGDQGADILPS